VRRGEFRKRGAPKPHRHDEIGLQRSAEGAHEGPDGGGRPVLALWAERAEQTVTIPATRAATLTDLMGGVQTLPPADGKVTVTPAPGTPVFLSLDM